MELNLRLPQLLSVQRVHAVNSGFSPITIEQLFQDCSEPIVVITIIICQLSQLINVVMLLLSFQVEIFSQVSRKSLQVARILPPIGTWFAIFHLTSLIFDSSQGRCCSMQRQHNSTYTSYINTLSISIPGILSLLSSYTETAINLFLTLTLFLGLVS